VYEPLWAMGTSIIASADQTQESCETIRKWVAQNVNEEAGEQVRIVYGGSVTETNAENFIKLNDVDGFLVGTISTRPIFRTIFEMTNKQVENEKW
jgi:triosephosphate isomerase (TIM)